MISNDDSTSNLSSPFWRRQELRSLPTPFYVYDLDGIRNRVEVLKKSLPKNAHIHFAMKSNHNRAVLKALHELGLGVDLVSSGEMRVAHEACFRAEQMIFSGVGKTRAEILSALELGIHQLNVESLPELERIAEIAKAHAGRSTKVKVALRINPDIDVNTHPYIRTGFRENKFGFDFSEVQQAVSILDQHKDMLELIGLAIHIGSQIRDLVAIRDAIQKSLSLWRELKVQGFSLKSFDVGGGLGIDYLSGDLAQDDESIRAYGEMLKNEVATHVERIDLEPGRILVARFGALITEVQYVKRTPYKTFLIIDAGMNALMRPALYQAHHRIVPVKSSASDRMDVFDIVGPICESADVLGAKRVMPSDVKAGDRLAVLDVGAYGYVMSNHYNLREPLKEYILDGGQLQQGTRAAVPFGGD